MRARRHATALLATASPRQRTDNQAALERFARSIDDAITISTRRLSDELRAAINEQRVVDEDLLDATIQILEGAFEDDGRAFADLSTDRRATSISLVYQVLVKQPGDVNAVTRRVRLILEATR